MSIEEMLKRLPTVVPTKQDSNKYEVVECEGYIPHLYYDWDDDKWCVEWLHYYDNESLFVIVGNTSTEAVTEAYNYCIEDGLIKEPFLERLIKEQSELKERITKLNNALSKDGFREKVGEFQFNCMSKQLPLMEEYFSILTSRINSIGIEASNN